MAQPLFPVVLTVTMPEPPSQTPRQPAPAAVQGRLAEFAIGELVRQHRSSFAPLWSTESWVKLLIWLALNCGCSGDEAGLRAFRACLDPALSRRLRQQFFTRELELLQLQVVADPAEGAALVLPLAPGGAPVDLQRAAAAVAAAGLEAQLVADRGRWSSLEGAVAIPWQLPPLAATP